VGPVTPQFYTPGPAAELPVLQWRVMPARHPAALLLTGGASRRLGRDKASLPLGPTTLAARTAALLAEVAAPVVEVGPGRTSLPHVQETPPGQGPLAAVAAGWATLARPGRPAPDHALVVATDLPRLTGSLLGWLAGHPAPGCVVPVDAAGRPQYLCARYSAAALRRAVLLVGRGRTAMRDLLDDGEAPVTLAGPAEWQPAAGRSDALADIDTPADLERLSGPTLGVR
jgi:molybdopterin-guanine dinucleotide biosynthesis protein A